MHPFWAVRRMTAPQLAQVKAALPTTGAQMAPRFNCEINMVPISAVTIAATGGQLLNRTRLIDVPFLTNSAPLVKGEELILEIQKREHKPTASKRVSSRDNLKLQEKDTKPEKKQKTT